MDLETFVVVIIIGVQVTVSFKNVPFLIIQRTHLLHLIKGYATAYTNQMLGILLLSIITLHFDNTIVPLRVFFNA